MKYVDATGKIFQTEVPGLQGDTITSIAAGGGTVALGTDQGRVFAWNPGSGDFRQVGQLPGAILSTATYGGAGLRHRRQPPVGAVHRRRPDPPGDPERHAVRRHDVGRVRRVGRGHRPDPDPGRAGRHLAVPGDRPLPALARRPGRSTTCTRPPPSRGSRPSPAGSWSGRTRPTAGTTCSPPPSLEGSDDRALGPVAAGGWPRSSWRWAWSATGCDTGIDGIDGDDGPADDQPVTLVVSETWVNDHQGDPGAGGAAGGSDVQARLTTLQKAIDAAARGDRHRLDRPAGRRHRLPLRAQRRVVAGHPDRVHGRPTARTCSASTPRVLRLGEPDTVTVPGHRHHQGHPGRRRRAGPRRVARLRRARRPGDRRPRPGLPRAHGARPTPTLPADQARAVAEQASRGTAQAPPSLVVMPRGAGVLAWLVPVATTGDATTPHRRRQLLHRRRHRRHPQRPAGHRRGPGRAPLGGLGRDVPAPRPPLERSSRGRTAVAPGRRADPDPNSVEITGPNPIGGTLTGHGVQTGKGVELVDTTTPSWDQATRDRRHLDVRRHAGQQQRPAARQARGQPGHHDPRRRGDGRAGAEPRRLRLLRVAGPQLVGRRGRLDGLVGPLRPVGLLQLRSSPARCASRRWSTATRAPPTRARPR